jgi:carbonic anhydrase
MKKAQFTVAVAGALLSMFALSPLVHAAGKAVKPGTFCTIQDTKECQAAVTPAQVLARFKAGNTRFVSGKPRHQNYLKEMKATADGQFPLASVVSCIDSRAPAEIVFDQGIGDLFNARVAGNIVNEDILGSLEFAHKVVGAKLLVVMGHTSCGAIKGACDDAQLGNLTGLIGKIKPAVNLVSADIKDRTLQELRLCRDGGREQCAPHRGNDPREEPHPARDGAKGRDHDRGRHVRRENRQGQVL